VRFQGKNAGVGVRAEGACRPWLGARDLGKGNLISNIECRISNNEIKNKAGQRVHRS